MIYLGLGTNLGNRIHNLRRALNLLREHIAITTISSVYDSAPMYITDQPRFYNMVVECSTDLSAVELLQVCKDVERAVGRGKGRRYGPRVMDVDILLYHDARLSICKPELEIPHPAMLSRAFVLLPLAEINSTLIHPVTGRKCVEYLAALNADIKKLGGLYETHC